MEKRPVDVVVISDVHPVNKKDFDKSLITCFGIITGGGFETPAEALYLGKNLMTIPIHGQYEQLCNAAALKKMGIPVFDKLDDDFTGNFTKWISDPEMPRIKYDYSTEAIVNILMYRCTNLKYQLDIPYPHLIFN